MKTESSMPSFDEDKTPLTLDNVQAWARVKFPSAFSVLPKVDQATFVSVDDFKFDRSISRSLGRSEHKKLLVVGAHAPGPEAEDVLVCAHVHAEDTAVSYFWIEELANGDNELHTVKSTGQIAFHAPFSGVGDDSGNAKAIKRVEAIISYYFLAANHVKELVRYKKFANLFTKGFEEGCRWIENGGERPVTRAATRASTTETEEDEAPAINPSVLRSATRVNNATAIKRVRDSIDVQERPVPKRTALNAMSTNVARPTPKPSHIVKLPLVSNHDENARLKTQVATLTAEKADLHQQLAKQGHAYRGCQLDLDETKEEVADLQAMLKSAQDANTDLRAAMKNILDVAAAQKL